MYMYVSCSIVCITIPDDVVDCCDPTCKAHSQQLDSVWFQILECLLRGSCLCLPQVKKHRHTIPGWNVRAHSLKQSAMFWHKVWSEFGYPSTGVLFQIKKNAKKRLKKYEVRRLRRQCEYVKRERLGTALSQNKQGDFGKQSATLSIPLKVLHLPHLM